MIKINLLPEELKRKRQFNTYILTLLCIAVGVLVIIVVISLVLGVQVKVQSARFSRLNKEWDVIRKEEKEVLGLEVLRVELDGKKKAIEDLAQSRLLWSRKLYQLSRQVLPSIWLADFNITTRTEKVKVPVKPDPRKGRKKKEASQVAWVQKSFQTIILKGTVISLSGEEMIDSVGKFMTSLKDDKDFFQDFSDIELIFTQRKVIQEQDAMDFELACRLK